MTWALGAYTNNGLKILSGVLLVFLFLLSVNSKAIVTASNTPAIELREVDRPAQRRYAYAGKLQWNSRKRKWVRVIVIYNGAPEPEPNHPVWRYVKNIKMPAYYGRYNQDLHFQPFYLTANCSGRTPLSLGRPWVINFDRLSPGHYSKADLRKDWNCPKWNMGNSLVNVVSDDLAYKGRSLRIQYLKGESGCYDAKQCVSWKPGIGAKFNKLYYGFRVKFAEDFDFVKGGKLPGLGGGKSNSSGQKPTGNDGWSVRTMWNKDGKLVQYVYHPDQQGKFGDIFKWAMDTPIEKGRWHTIQTMVLLNHPGKSDGVIRTWLNGNKVLDQQGLRFRNGKGLKIDKLLFASFFGGSGPFWAPSDDQFAYIDDVILSPTPPFYR